MSRRGKTEKLTLCVVSIVSRQCLSSYLRKLVLSTKQKQRQQRSINVAIVNAIPNSRLKLIANHKSWQDLSRLMEFCSSSGRRKVRTCDEEIRGSFVAAAHNKTENLHRVLKKGLTINHPPTLDR
jgi:hypothetical protein